MLVASLSLSMLVGRVSRCPFCVQPLREFAESPVFKAVAPRCCVVAVWVLHHEPSVDRWSGLQCGNSRRLCLGFTVDLCLMFSHRASKLLTGACGVCGDPSQVVVDFQSTERCNWCTGSKTKFGQTICGQNELWPNHLWPKPSLAKLTRINVLIFWAISVSGHCWDCPDPSSPPTKHRTLPHQDHPSQDRLSQDTLPKDPPP